MILVKISMRWKKEKVIRRSKKSQKGLNLVLLKFLNEQRDAKHLANVYDKVSSKFFQI